MNKEYEDLKELAFPNGKLFPKVVVSPEEFAASVKKVFTEMADILIKKNQMYGNSSMDLGLIGIYIHEHDKVMRLRSILERVSSGEKLHFEGIEDTLRDMIGYAVLGLTVFEALKNGIPAKEALPSLSPEQAMGRQMKISSMGNPHGGTAFAEQFDLEEQQEIEERR